ncbi:MAG: ABC transporter permease, partial [Oscillospiraceae bacterium]
ENEVIVDSMSLQLLGVPAEIGQTLSLELDIRGETVTRDFVLSGYWESDPAFNVGQIFSSRAYVDAHLEELQNTFKENHSIMGTINASIMFYNSLNLEAKLNTLITDCGFSPIETDTNYIASNVNWSYLSTNFGMDFGTIGTLSLGLLLIIFTGYLIIYNIFQISVIQDVRFYGLLKTIGTTGKQIKKIITTQAFKLCIFGIPVGLIVGFFVGKLLVPLLMSNTNYAGSNVNVSINPIIFIGATAFSLLTVFLSTRKPCKTAGKISPIEAVRYTDLQNTSKKKAKKNSKIRMVDLAISNLGRNKKRTTITVISLSLCIVLLNTVFILAGSIDMDKFLQKFFDADFLVAHADYFNSDFYGTGNATSEQMIATIENLDGFENGGRLYGGSENTFLTDVPENEFVLNRKSNDKAYIALYGLEDFPFGRLELIDGEIDKEKLLSGKYILEGVSLDDNSNPELEKIHYQVGDTVTLWNWDETESTTFTVLGHVAIKTYTNSDRISWGYSTFYLPSEAYLPLVET